jgi:iron complex transport system substrate-binding protein
LGLEDQLVAVTHECDHPPSVRGKPVVTRSVLPSGLDGGAIDRHIRGLVHAGSSIYTLDSERLLSLHPDLILTQELCAVCAVSYPLVERAARRSEGPVQMVSFEPERLRDVFEHIALVGRLCGREAEAHEVVAGLRLRVEAVRERLGSVDPVRVVCLEWIDPPYNAGHWTPELVRLAGGTDPLAAEGRPAHPIDWQAVGAAQPDVLVVMACGFSLERSLDEARGLSTRPELVQVPAVASGRVHVVDGNAYFSRPGPRLVDSLEILAGLLHPDRVAPPAPSAAVRLDRFAVDEVSHRT